jgi:hypothetical protein
LCQHVDDPRVLRVDAPNGTEPRMLAIPEAADTSFWQAHVTKKVTHTGDWLVRHYWWALTHRDPQDVGCGFMEELRHRHCS